MEQLSGTDSFMLYSEHGNNYNHVAGLGVYDPSTAPGGKVRFKDILRHFAARIGEYKVFRRRLASVPLGADRPYWIEDPDIDLEFHIRHIALPQPGDWRQLMIQVARIHSRPLDRSRPLWEVYVIEGLDRIPDMPKGSFAIMQKYHHASVDGQAAVALMKAIHALAPDADVPASETVESYAEREPAPAELLSRALLHGVKRAAGLASLSLGTLQRAGGGTLRAIAARFGEDGSAADLGDLWPGFERAPKTRFNRAVSANRVVEAVALPLDAIKRARVEGTTINDFFLAIVGGALRRYLAAKEELPGESLVALMPISLRASHENALGSSNEVGGVPVVLHTEIDDPVERLKACHAASQAAKQSSDKLGRGFLKTLMDGLPHAAAEAFLRHVVLTQLNVTVSNVRGPDVPLYVAGARLVHFYPVSIASDYVGLNHTGFSYNDKLWISAVACRNMLPDPAFYAQCLRESFDELITAIEASHDRAAGGVRPKPSKGAAPKPVRSRKRPGTTPLATRRRSKPATVRVAH